MLAVVESGKFDTKYKGCGILGKFNTKYTIDEKVIDGVDTNTYNITFNGNTYKVGDCGGDNNYEVSKNRDIHKVSILTALSIMKPYGYTNFNLVTGTPVNLFFTDERDKIKESLVGEYKTIFHKNKKDEECAFRIEKVLVAPETMGYVYNNYDKCKNEMVKVIDIGGLNTNGLIYKDGKPIKDTGFTINEGMNILTNSIIKELNRDGYNYQKYEVEYLLRKGSTNKREDDVLSNVVSEHLNKLARTMRANNWNIDTGNIIFTGGGSLTLTNEINKNFNNAVISNDCIYDNANGFYKLGEALL